MSPDILDRFSPYESTLRADDGSVPYFSICQGTLPWQPNHVAVMKANWYYVHSLHVLQMEPSFVSLIHASGRHWGAERRLARLCHAFLVYRFLWAKVSQYLLDRFSRFSPRHTMISAVYADVVCLCGSDCPSHSSIVSKRLNVGSHK